MNEPWFGSATEWAARLGQGVISATELTQLQLDRIAVVNPSVNALIEVHAAAALSAAAAADRAVRRGDRISDLHGIPISIKEAFQVAGYHSTWGEPHWAAHRSETDATVVRRLREAGTVLLGTSNVATMLGDFGQTTNEVYGRTVNPWNGDLVPGGSTGGGAAAVAAGLSFLDYGSDLVGSVRIPAALCGVYGLKASVGIVPGTGLQPPGPPAPAGEPAYQLGFGPLARSAADIRAALRCTAGPELPAAAAWKWTLPPARHARLRDYRVRVVLDHALAPVTSEVGAALSDAVDELAQAGVPITEGWPDGVDPAADAACFGAQVGLYFAYVTGETESSLRDAVQQERHRMAARGAWQRCLTTDADVFLCPTTFTGPFAHDERPFDDRTIDTGHGEQPYAALPFWISHASLTGLPSLSAPITSVAPGRPAGMQIIGPLYEDDTAITFAELAADVTGGFRPPSPSPLA